MRYKNDETTVLGGFFKSGSQVTIKVLDDNGQAIQLTNDACIVSPDESSLYLWSTTNMQSEAGTYFYIMTDGINKMPGKFIYGGYVEDVAKISDVQETQTIMMTAVTEGNSDVRQIIEDVQLGNWSIENRQMVMKTQSGKELATFNLYDFNGNPTNTTVAKRIRVS